MSNPLLREYTDKIAAGHVDRWSFDGIARPEPYGEGRNRRDLANEFSWAVPGDEALDALAGLSPLVEIGAGRGYWASLLLARGADIVCYDIAPPTSGRTNRFHDRGPTFAPVKYGGAPRAAAHPDRTLFLCWPPYATDFAVRCVRAYAGNTVAYVGEGEGGCTADDAFFRLLDREWDLDREVAIPQWSGIHDRLEIYRRRRPA